MSILFLDNSTPSSGCFSTASCGEIFGLRKTRGGLPASEKLRALNMHSLRCIDTHVSPMIRLYLVPIWARFNRQVIGRHCLKMLASLSLGFVTTPLIGDRKLESAAPGLRDPCTCDDSAGRRARNIVPVPHILAACARSSQPAQADLSVRMRPGYAAQARCFVPDGPHCHRMCKDREVLVRRTLASDRRLGV